MARKAKWLQRLGLTASALALLGLGACDRQQERLDRVSDLTGSVLDQLTGNESEDSDRDRLAKVPVEARAFAGELRSAQETSDDSDVAAQFVIGAIVAKPAELPPSVTMAEVMAAPQMAMNVVVDEQADSKIVIPDQKTVDEIVLNPEKIQEIQGPVTKQRSITVIDPKVTAPTRALSSSDPVLPRAPLQETVTNKRVEQGLEAPQVRSRMMALELPQTPEERMAQLPRLDPKVARRAMIQPTAALERQLRAEEKMIETATKFKVAASIQRSRSGQMVIEIGSGALNPTSFSGNVIQQGRIALENGVECDEVAAQSEDANPLVAMECVIRDLKASGEFEYVEKDWIYEHQMIRRPDTPVGPVKITPNDPLFGLQWHYKSQGSGTGQSAGGAGFVDFWTNEASQGSSEVVVAVVDTGLQLDHPDIKDSPNVAPGWDMVSDITIANDGNSRDSDPNDPGDVCPERGVLADTFHGTHVAGIIGAGATNNSDGVAGGAWNVKIVPVRALGKCGGKVSDINDAIRWAAGTIPEFNELGEEVWNENPADIINLSLGLFKTCPRSMQDAINDVTSQGVVVVVAAGNKSVPTEFFAPAGCQNVVTVAGGDARGYLAPYSNYGAAVDLIAPGGDLTRDDDGDGNPDGVLSTKTALNCADPLTGSAVPKCYYAYEQGTSMATPHVSAALALIKSKKPDLSSDDLVSTLLSAVSPVSGAQCTGPCSQFPGTTPTADDPNMCLRPCGSGLLNLADVSLPE